MLNRLQRRRPSPKVWWIVAAVVASCLVWTTASASAAEISGFVFNDFNTNGVFEDNATIRDVPAEGFTVKAFTGVNHLVGSAVTGANGRYSMNLPPEKVRLELWSPGSSGGVAPPWWPTRIFIEPGGVRSDVQFIDASSHQTNVDFAVHRPDQWSFEDPTLFWPTQWAGPPLPSNPNLNQIAIRGAPYSSKRPPGAVQTWANLANRVDRATFGQIGTVFGLADDNRTNDLYAGAYQKRFAGLKNSVGGTVLSSPPGAIFKITPDGHVSLFRDLPAGADPHPEHGTIEDTSHADWVSCGPLPGATPARTGSATITDHRMCDFSWTEVGKIGLGSVVIDPQDKFLYTVNLLNKELYRIPLSGGGQAATPIPDPGCANGDWRPFSLGFDDVNDQLYLGGVCSAETSQAASNLRAVVYRVANPQSFASDARARAAQASFVQVLNFALNYQRAPSPALDNGVDTLQYCGANTTLAAPTGGFCRWNPWPTPGSTGGYAPSNTRFGTEQNNANYPQLSAITFAEDGSMILGFRDLIGDMGGVFIPDEIGANVSGNPGLGPMVHGDMLRAGANGGGTFTLEANGRVAGLTSTGQIGPCSTHPQPCFNPGAASGFTTSSFNWGYGPGIGPGPCAVTTSGCSVGNPGGYFYNPRPLAPATVQFQIPHPYQGGLIQIPGFADVVATSIHIRDAQENGLLWRDNRDGETKAALQNYITPGTDQFNGFAKANGLGDIAAYTGAPIQEVQIGNRLWYDTPHSGIQEPGEAPVTDALVELFDCHGRGLESTHTDSHGEYAFNIEAGLCYTVRVPLDQPPLHGWAPTRAFVGHDARIDSNGVRQGAFVVAHVSPKGPGENNFTYDFGFFKSTTTEEKPPPPPPPHHQLEVFKRLLSQSGHTVVFEMIVRNGGPRLVVNVRVCDSLPPGLEFVGASASGTRTGNEVCWHLTLLPSGAQRTFHLTARVRPGTLTGAGTMNCVDARGTIAAGPDSPVRPVGPVRACATARGTARPPSFTG